MNVHKIINKFIVKVLKFVTFNQIYSSFSSIETSWNRPVYINLYPNSSTITVTVHRDHSSAQDIAFNSVQAASKWNDQPDLEPANQLTVFQVH